MVRKLQTILVLSLLLATTAIGQKKLFKANKQYNLKHYALAIETYNDFLKSQPGNVEATTNLADCYRMSNDLVAASKLYEELVTIEHIDPTVIKNYGLTLTKMGKYDQAMYYFKIYKVYDPEEGGHHVMSCQFAKNLFEKSVTHDIEVAAINTNRSDFGVSFIGDQLVFSSFRNDILTENMGKTQALNGNVLYVADVDDKMRTSNVRTLKSGIAEKNNIGPVSYNEAGGIVVYSRNKIKDGGAHVTGNDSKHSLYVATLTENGDWKDDHSFRYNEFGTSTAFPSLAFDGSALYFSSNRVGGYGGYDIYVSYLKKGGWTYPTNLGPNINTKGNEITPYFHEESIYFASDYLHGMGGYDIFESQVLGGQWTHPINLGNGINSPGDDYYPALKRGSDMVFFSSNRLGGRGMDDIYLAVPVSDIESEEVEEFVEVAPPAAVSIADYVSQADPRTENPLANTVSNDNSTKVTLINLDETPRGKIMIEEISNRNCHILKYNNNPINSVEYAVIPSTLELTDIAGVDDVDVLDENSTITTTIDNQTVRSSFEVEEDGSLVESIIVEASEPVLENTTKEVEWIDITEEESSNSKSVVSTEIELTEEKPDAFKIPEFKSVSPVSAPLNVDLSKAKRVALGQLMPQSEVFFIQLAALYSTSGNIEEYNDLKQFGNIYKMYKSSSTKIKLGYFLDRDEAQSVLGRVKNHGYRDAFITKDYLDNGNVELVGASEMQSQYDSYTSKPNYIDDNNNASTNTSSVKSYKIRLASYEDPIWFDIQKAKGLGQIEQWTKGSWTIFILSGYTTYESAESARIRAVNKGFADAEVVVDNNGILERLRRN